MKFVTVGCQVPSGLDQAGWGQCKACPSGKVCNPWGGFCQVPNRTLNSKYEIKGLEKALLINNVDVRIFGKSKAWPGRRLGVILSSEKENGEAAKKFISIVKSK